MCDGSWFNAKVRCLLGSDKSGNSEFEVKHKSFEVIYKRKLIEDLKNNLIVVVDKRKRLISTEGEFEKENGSPRHGRGKRDKAKRFRTRKERLRR